MVQLTENFQIQIGFPETLPKWGCFYWEGGMYLNSGRKPLLHVRVEQIDHIDTHTALLAELSGSRSVLKDGVMSI